MGIVKAARLGLTPVWIYLPASISGRRSKQICSTSDWLLCYRTQEGTCTCTHSGNVHANRANTIDLAKLIPNLDSVIDILTVFIHELCHTQHLIHARMQARFKICSNSCLVHRNFNSEQLMLDTLRTSYGIKATRSNKQDKTV
jgi:hypothetical protein